MFWGAQQAGGGLVESDGQGGYRPQGSVPSAREQQFYQRYGGGMPGGYSPQMSRMQQAFQGQAPGSLSDPRVQANAAVQRDPTQMSRMQRAFQGQAPGSLSDPRVQANMARQPFQGSGRYQQALRMQQPMQRPMMGGYGGYGMQRPMMGGFGMGGYGMQRPMWGGMGWGGYQQQRPMWGGGWGGGFGGGGWGQQRAQVMPQGWRG